MRKRGNLLAGTAAIVSVTFLLAGCPAEPADLADEGSQAAGASQQAEPASGSEQKLPASALVVDPTVQPATATIEGLDGSSTRPLAAVTDRSGVPVEFVENELLIVTDSDGAAEEFAARWGGEKVATYDPADHGLPGERVHLVRINPAMADLSQVESDLAVISPGARNDLRVSSKSGAGVIAAAAREIADGANVGVNFVLRSHGFRDRVVREGAAGPASEMIGGATFNPDPFTWSYMQLGGNQNIGVAEAWTMLDWAGKLGNKIDMAVIDGGFAQTSDMPSPWTHHTNSIHAMDPHRANENTCTGGARCDWHGVNVACTMAGRADNRFGAAGSGAPIVGRMTTIRMSGDVFNYIGAFGIAFSSGARIVNMSFGARVPATLTPALTPFNAATAGARAAGILLFASAGNDASDVDGEDCFDPCPIVDCEICWEEAWFAPCENEGVIGVGALNDNATTRRASSNWGNEEVNIFGPGAVWVADDPAKQFPHVFTATSAASPFVAGVAGLVWAANPGLSADEVERILMETAHGSSDPAVRRYVNAYGACLRALGNSPPEVRITSPSPDLRERGFGGTNIPFACEARDLEDGTPQVVWTSDRVGVIGEGLNFARSDLPFGRHVITCRATDSKGASVSATLTFELTNALPRVSIDRPVDGASYFSGQRVLFRAWSFDPELFGQLPNESLAWSSDRQGALGAGRQIEADLTATGNHVITLVGTDSQGQTARSTINVWVSPAPPNLPPTADIVDISGTDVPAGRDADNSAYFDVTLTAYAYDRENGYLSGNAVSWRIESAVVRWEVVPGELEFGTQVRRRVRGFGNARIVVTVTDRDGNTGTAFRDITIQLPPR